jgi:patatin-like phospholipase/acyl hydrolase
MSKFRILSIDGGGIKGIIPVTLIQRLTQSIPGWLDSVDLIAGTSTGGLIALSLAAGLTLDEIAKFYIEKGKDVFDDSWIDNVADIGKIAGADYDIANLESILEDIFGTKKLKDLNKNVLIPSFSLDRKTKVDSTSVRAWAPKIFHNIEGPDNDGEMLVYKVGLYTSAAPTYFETYDGYIDGSVFADNPSMCAIGQALDQRNSSVKPGLNDIVMLSLGTGFSPSFIEGKSHDWGYAGWAKPLISLFMDGISGIADYECKQLLRERYCRLDMVFPKDTVIKLDDYKKVPQLIELANNLNIDSTVKFIKEIWKD